MKKMIIPALLSLFYLAACNQNDKSKPDNGKADTLTREKSEVKPGSTAKRPPIINITDSISLKRIVLCMRDSAASSERIGLKLGQIYGAKLAAVFSKEKLKVTGAPMAWYQTAKAPYFFEAGMPVNKKPVKLPAGVFIRETGADSVIVAHFYGPYDLISQAYEAVKERMKDTKRTANGAPYEIYVSDPIDKKGKPVDPYKVQTDVVFPVK